MTTNIDDYTLINLGFKLGPLGHTWRLDGYSGDEWYYIQALPPDEHGVVLHTYGLDPDGEFMKLDRSQISDTEELRQYTESLLDVHLNEKESLIRPIKMLTFRCGKGRTFITI